MRGELAQQVVQSEVLERGVGDALDLLDRVGHGLGLGARGLLAHPLRALDLGLAPLGDVDHLPDAAARLAVGVVRQRRPTAARRRRDRRGACSRFSAA